MRTLVYTGPEKLVMEDRPRPVLVAGDVEVGIEVAGICGSDISGFLGHSALRKPGLVMGHELVGRLSDGKRVVANPLISCGHCEACVAGAQNLCATWRLLGAGQTPGSFAEYVALPTGQLHEIPESLPSSRAILTEPLANIVHLLRIVSPPPLFRFAIVGAGTMGALALAGALRAGARDTLVVDINDERLAIMKTMGANAAINTASAGGVAEAQKLAGRGFDFVLDASGSGPARQMAFDLCRPGGHVCLLGMGAQKSEVNFVASIRKEHRVIMSFAYTPADFRRALDLLIAGEIDLTAWTVKMPLEDGQQAFERMTHAPGPALKMVLSIAN
jgi:threonine dehydrogenase-like Zn-dependent dehydrogenase